LKIDKANELGVKILDMGEFEKMIGLKMMKIKFININVYILLIVIACQLLNTLE
jgi:hypothetical protein